MKHILYDMGYFLWFVKSYIYKPNAAFEMTGLLSFYDWREKRCLNFSLKCLKHPRNSKLFPLNPNYLNPAHEGKNSKRFIVNFATTDTFKDSAIPHCQRLLNQDYSIKTWIYVIKLMDTMWMVIYSFRCITLFF